MKHKNFVKSMLKVKNRGAVVLLFFVMTSVQAQLVHPGISHNMADLERMKAMVETGEEPWASEFAHFSSSNLASCDYEIKGDGRTELINLGEFGTDGYAAYYNALMYVITGDECHAQKCVEIFNSWTNLKRVPNTFALSNGRYVWKMCEGAEIIKHTYSGWSETDQQAFGDMLVYPGWSGTTTPTAAIESRDVSFYWNLYQGDPVRYGNQGLFGFRSLIAMAIFLDNEIMYERVVRYLQGFPHRLDDLPYPSGPPNPNTNSNAQDCKYIEERGGAGLGNTIADYGYNEVIGNYIWENGQCQEAARDQVHTGVGIHILSCIAEIAWKQGDDLYGHLDNRILKGFEYFMRYNVGDDRFSAYGYPDWNPTVASGEFISRRDRSERFLSKAINPHVVCDETRYTRGQDILDPYYEMPLGHYRDRLKLPASDYQWTTAGQNIYKNEVGYETINSHNEAHGWGGFKFHRVSSGDPISGFSGNGLPIYKMNELPMTIEAENYDYFVLDGQGRTYNDSDTGNSGGEYRTDEGVDLKVCSEGGYNVTDIADGEWLTYTVNVPANGTYNISIRYASANANGKIKFSFNEEDTTPEVTVPFGGENSTGLTDWKDFKVANEVNLKKGVQQMKVLFSGASNAFELNNISVVLVQAEPDPVNLAVLHGTAAQSTDRLTDYASKAIDGNTNGVHGNGSVTHTSGNATSDPEPWWQVDLGNNYTIENIKVYNRTDCCSDRLNNFTVEVINTNGNVVFSQFYATAPSNAFIVTTGDVVGSIVRISKTSSTALALAEVEVYGVNQVVLSNSDFKLANNIKLFPNPANTEINISNATGAKVSIYNIFGAEVLTTGIEQNQQKIGLGNITSGVYFVRILKDGRILTKKIIKK